MTRTPPPSRRVWPPETYEAITLQRDGDVTVVITAPQISLISLAIFDSPVPGQLKIFHHVIEVAGTVDYEVIGWDRAAAGLIVRRIADRRGINPRSGPNSGG